MSNQQPLHTLTCSVTTDLDLAVCTDQFQQAKKEESPPPKMCIQYTDSNLSTSDMEFSTDEQRETVSMRTLLSQLSQVEIDCAFAIHGYKKLNKICATLQGELFKAQNITNGEFVAIKKIDKSSSDQQIAIDDDETAFCVAQNITKEAKILKHLTVNNTSIGRHIIRYIDFFADDSSYFLVMEYIETEMNLKQFVTLAHQYIADGKLRRKHYQRIMKYLFWQLVVTVHWMHNDMNCCHLDLHSNNIMLQNCDFEEDKDGYLRINSSIIVKLGDFGVAEIFHKDFKCNKTDLSLENASYLAPNVYAEEIYDARCADMWSLGMIIFECLTGGKLYDPMDIFATEYNEFDGVCHNGYAALHNGNLRRYLLQHTELRCFTTDSLDLLLNLLQTDEQRRFRAADVLQHQWFTMYFRKYSKQIKRKSVTQKKRSLHQKKTIHLDFYKLH